MRKNSRSEPRILNMVEEVFMEEISCYSQIFKGSPKDLIF